MDKKETIDREKPRVVVNITRKISTKIDKNGNIIEEKITNIGPKKPEIKEKQK